MTQETATEDYRRAVQAAILSEAAFVRATLSGSQHGRSVPYVKVVLRPVALKGENHVQFAFYDDKKCVTKNYRGEELTAHLDELLGLPFRSIYVASTEGDLQITTTKKGRAIVHRGRPSGESADLPHNRVKSLPLPEGRPDAYLQAIGVMTQEGQIRADQQKKFKQTNEFLKLIAHTGALEAFTKTPLDIVDFGCGNAYLTFAVYHYLNDILHIPARMVGVDLRGELLEKHARIAADLGWPDFHFVRSAIAAYAPPTPPDITLALHACDTATDDALASGIQNGSKIIVSVPCCHHHLQAQLDKAPTPEAFRPVARHGILAERLGDVLTDAFRALILRLMGYQTDVMQFVSAEHTAKNVMIRAVHANLPPLPALVREYTAMKAFWEVTPYLETRLGNALTERLT